MDFEEAVDRLYSFQKFGIKPGLERINYLVEKLGNPYLEYDTIHVGGTNGKGSVCKILASILNEAGYSVGVFTSPHLSHIRERIVVNGEMISDEDFSKLVEQIMIIVEKMKNNSKMPTFFEIITAMAFEYFKKRGVDIAIVEVGLGGRHDATNVIHPRLTILTDISLDHSDMLGRNIRSVASEKAGIIKEKISVVTVAKGEALEVVKHVAKEKDTDVSVMEDVTWKRLNVTDEGQEFVVRGKLKDYYLKTSLLGKYQGENITLAVLAAEQLQMLGLYLQDGSIEHGVALVTHPGRMELVSRKPYIVLDGAHNSAGMHALIETLADDFSYDKLIGVIGILKDKDIESMVREFAPFVSYVIITKSKNKRACDTKMLAQLVKKYNSSCIVEIKDDIRDAVSRAKEVAEIDDLVCIAGSLYTVGEARECLI